MSDLSAAKEKGWPERKKNYKNIELKLPAIFGKCHPDE